MSVKVKKRSGQGGISNLYRESKITALLWQKLAEKEFGKKYHNTPIKGMVSHRLMQKH